MKKYIILLVFVSFVTLAKTQSYSFSPSKIYKLTVDVSLGFQSWDLKIKNNKTDSLTIHWKKLLENFPKAWDYSICDYGTCYAIIPDSSTMTKIAPNEEGFFKLDLVANGTPGYAKLLLLMGEIGSTKPLDTVGFDVAGALPAGINSVSDNALSLYPNPVQNVLYIRNISSASISQLYITDMMGHSVSSMSLIDRNTVNTENLNNGMYILKVLYKDGSVLNQSFIKQ